MKPGICRVQNHGAAGNHRVLFPAVRYFYRLGDNTTDNWEKSAILLLTITGRSGRKADNIIILTGWAHHQLMRGPIYLIPDNMTVRALLSDDLRVDDLRKMAHDGRLQDISGNSTEMLKATTRYKESCMNLRRWKYAALIISMFSFLNFSDDD